MGDGNAGECYVSEPGPDMTPELAPRSVGYSFPDVVQVVKLAVRYLSVLTSIF